MKKIYIALLFFSIPITYASTIMNSVRELVQTSQPKKDQTTIENVSLGHDQTPSPDPVRETPPKNFKVSKSEKKNSEKENDKSARHYEEEQELQAFKTLLERLHKSGLKLNDQKEQLFDISVLLFNHINARRIPADEKLDMFAKIQNELAKQISTARAEAENKIQKLKDALESSPKVAVAQVPSPSPAKEGVEETR